MNRWLVYLALYFLAIITAPVLGFTAVMDFGELATGHPGLALLWMCGIGPALMLGLAYSSERWL